LFGAVEIVAHEEHLKLHRVGPVRPAVPAGSGIVIVRNVAVQQLLVQVLIYLEKEIVGSAIDDQGQRIGR